MGNFFNSVWMICDLRYSIFDLRSWVKPLNPGIVIYSGMDNPSIFGVRCSVFDILSYLLRISAIAYHTNKKKAPERRANRGCKESNEAMTYSPAQAVPSAQRSLTAVFGMGTGGTSALKSPHQ
jgi:hypothetical protein